LSAKIASSEAEITNLRQNQSNKELIKEAEELEAQAKHLEEELQKLLRKQESPNSNRELEAKRKSIEQEYQCQKSESNTKPNNLYQEYKNKFKEIATPLADLIPQIQKQLTQLGYKKVAIVWKNANFGHIHLTTLESSVNLEIVKE